MLKTMVRATLVAGMLLLGWHGPPAFGADLSPATKRLFDAVWTDDLARVKASIVEGADLGAVNEMGIRAVDLAVDKGHYEIAHYLLSVEKISDEAQPAVQPVPTPTMAPVQPVPEPQPVAPVLPAAPAGAATSANPAPAAAPVNEPAPKSEAIWSPSKSGADAAAPKFNVIGTADPQSAPARPAASTPQAPAATKTQSNSSKSAIKPDNSDAGFIEKMTDFFKFSSKPKPATQAKPAPESPTPPTAPAAPAPPAKPGGGGQSALPQSGTPESVALQPSDDEAPRNLEGTETTEAALGPQTAKGEETSLLDRLSDFFQSGEAAPRKNADAFKQESDSQASIASPGPSPEAPPPAQTVEASPVEAPPVEKPVDSAAVADAEISGADVSDQGGSLIDKVVEFLKPELAKPSGDAAASNEAPQAPTQDLLNQDLAKPEIVRDRDNEEMAVARSETSAETDGPGLLSRLTEFFQPAAGPQSETAPTPVVAEPAPGSAQAPAEAAAEVAATPTRSVADPSAEPEGGIFDSLAKWLKRNEADTATPPTESSQMLAIKDSQVAEAPAAPPPAPALAPVAAPAPTPVAPVSPAGKRPGDVRVVRAPVIDIPAPRRGVEQPTAPRQPTESAAPPQELASIQTQPDTPALTRRVKPPVGNPAVQNPAKIAEPLIASAALKDVKFVLGAEGRLGVPLTTDQPRLEMCVDKSRWATKFCIEPISWPNDMAASFRAESSIYRGEKAIVQYVEGRSVQLHVLFPVGALWAVSEHFKKIYGPPTEMPDVWTALIGEPKRPNRVLRWHARDSKTGRETLLEIREIDDLRWSSPPDTKHGVVRILEKGRGSVFQLLSTTDLLLVSLRNRGQ